MTAATSAGPTGEGDSTRPYENRSFFDAYRFSELTRIETLVFGEYLTPNDRVLDLGCGTGRVSFCIAPKVRAVVGVDISELAIRRAMERLRTYSGSNLSFVRGDISDFDLPLGQFDKALIPYNSLEAIGPRAQRVRALVNVRDHLVDPGLLIFCVHNRHHYRTLLWTARDRLRSVFAQGGGEPAPGGVREPGSVVLVAPDRLQRFRWYLYTWNTVVEDVRSAGFRIVRVWKIDDQNPTTRSGLNAGPSRHRLNVLVPGFYLVCAKASTAGAVAPAARPPEFVRPG